MPAQHRRTPIALDPLVDSIDDCGKTPHSRPTKQGIMRPLIAIALLFLSAAVAADDIAARIAIGNVVQATASGKIYGNSLVPSIGAAFRACVPASGKFSPADARKFTLVGNVDASGHLSSVEVTLVTRTSTCFAQRLAAAPLPVPPIHAKDPPYPITVDVEIAH